VTVLALLSVAVKVMLCRPTEKKTPALQVTLVVPDTMVAAEAAPLSTEKVTLGMVTLGGYPTEALALPLKTTPVDLEYTTPAEGVGDVIARVGLGETVVMDFVPETRTPETTPLAVKDSEAPVPAGRVQAIGPNDA
jgi:hypothetical protein